MVLHQGAAGGGIAEIVGVPLEKSADLAFVRLDFAGRFKEVALGAPPVAFSVPAFLAAEHVGAQAAADLVVVLGARVGFLGHPVLAYYSGVAFCGRTRHNACAT